MILLTTALLRSGSPEALRLPPARTSALGWCFRGLAFLASREPTRPAYRVSGCPLVQDLWREVRTVRPGDRPDLRINSHLCEDLGVTQRREHPCPVPYMGQVHISRQAVRERQSEPVVAQHL